MKNNSLALMLVGILLISSVINLWLAYSYNSSLSRIRAIQPELVSVQNSRNALNVLSSDLSEYSRKNPSISPLLQTVGIPAAGTPAPAAATPKPATPAPIATKPAGK